MDRYVLKEKIGEGTFGEVFLATKKGDPNDTKFAVKRLKRKFSSWIEVKQQREVRALKDLSASSFLCRRGSDYIVQVYDIAREKDSKLYFVMEYMEKGTLHQYLGDMAKESRKMSIAQQSAAPVIPETKIRSIISQCLQGLCHVHSRGYMHRDIKPENILMGGDGLVKLADFSLARQLDDMARCSKRLRKALSPCLSPDDGIANSSSPSGNMTTYVATRWYRAPEILRGDPMYTYAVDIFALGLVNAEIYSLKPLLQGKDEVHQKQLMSEILGGPTPMESLSMDEVGVEHGMKNRRCEEIGLANALPTVNESAIRFIANMVRLDPDQRYTAKQALADTSYFQPSNKTSFRGGPDTLRNSISAATTPLTRPTGRSVPFVTISKDDRLRKSRVHEPNDVARAFLCVEPTPSTMGTSRCF
ncbi:serine/threonine protein kinase [Nitzschia inconspicua]|uniref:Serine/threonine protein kinase n=1 Tax=Nitzschia inconspicua TaxID=303405 RepID=A0A9K3PLS8_9STRA|nr:serine/threonine protein kinase [Nitzschia inconspicua]